MNHGITLPRPLCPKTPVFPQNGMASMNADNFFSKLRILPEGISVICKSEKKHNFMTCLKIVNDF